MPPKRQVRELSRRKVGELFEVVEEVTRYVEVMDVPAPVPEPDAPAKVLLDAAQTLELIGAGQSLTQLFGLTRALSINGSDREPGTTKPLQNSAKVSVSLVEMDGVPVVRHALILAKAGDEYGGRTQLIGAPHDNDPLRPFAGRTIRLSHEFCLPEAFKTVAGGNWCGLGQWKKEMYGKAHLQMNIDRDGRIYWATHSGSGVVIDGQRFPVVPGYWHRLVQEMNLSANTFSASIDGTQVAAASGALTMANGSVLAYPSILYGDFFQPGVEQVFLARRHRIEVI